MMLPPENKYRCEELIDIDIENEINAINKEMSGLVTNSLDWTKGDYITVFFAGILGGLVDIFLGKPADGYSSSANDGSLLGKSAEPKITKDAYFGLGEKLKQFDLKNNPIDAHIPGAPVGDHRLYSYGHDLFRFNKGLQLILKGTGPIGINGTGGEISLEQSLQGFTSPDEMWKAALILLLHLYKDFWSARSLPIPGSTIIANLNNDEMPEIIDELTNKHEVNLRQLSGQVLSVTIVEIINRIWIYFSSKKSDVSKELIDQKRNKMLLLSHSVAMAFNLGKVFVTKNPFFLNIPQILKIVILSFKVVNDEIKLTHNTMVKVDLGVIRNKYMTLQTLVMLDDAICYTADFNKFFIKQSEEYTKLITDKTLTNNSNFSEIDIILQKFNEI
ncbi:hypothetical protein [Geotalea uraniireducens]|nr:hypothetical protein [Geotalea uraniireducens]